MVSQEGMKACLFAIMTEDYFKGFYVTMKSFLYHNPWFDLDFVIIDINLNEETKKKILEIYPKVLFRKPNYGLYEGGNYEKLYKKNKVNQFYLECFNLCDYGKVVSIDLDLLILGDMRSLFFNTGDDLYCPKGFSIRKKRVLNTCQAGVFVVGKNYINKEIYLKLIEFSKQGFRYGEQTVINKYFQGQIKWLPKRYNVEKSMLKIKTKRQLFNDCVVLHFVGLHPWQDHSNCKDKDKGYEDLENLWWEWYHK